MSLPSSELTALAALIRETQAGSNLPPLFAKLYSQHTRLREQQPGLTGWRREEASERLKDAVRLIEGAFIERDAGGEQWRDGCRRAGELLEWLTHPSLNPQHLPMRLLSAATYQLAGYPARASGLLKDDPQDEANSAILSAFLKADFPELLLRLTTLWAERVRDGAGPSITNSRGAEDEAFLETLQDRIVFETASSLGVLCAEMRWGTELRLRNALDKLTAISKVLTDGQDVYSWLLAKLCAEVAAAYARSSLRVHLERVAESVNTAGRLALERYARQSYLLKRSLAWESQIRGIERLTAGQSFALCTPTGSGKTTIAELAILQSLFLGPDDLSENQLTVGGVAPLTLYLVPSRALAAEVEAKLSRVLRRVDATAEIVVTGLYGGTDWGPTDAWLTSDRRTVLICTYEKAEALIRFLGPLFLSRVTLVVMDEAHSVQFNNKETELRDGENRGLRLESVGTRLLAHLTRTGGRFVALSAVAAGVESALARWVTAGQDPEPTKTPYRSTRQLIGRLECLPNGAYEIYYDLLDGASLEFEDRDGGRPYIRAPFPPCPPVKHKTADSLIKRLRPQLFWAAMHLAKPDDRGQQRAVLISITERIKDYLNDLLDLLNSPWSVNAPAVFAEPSDPKKLDLWRRCLQACEDYYGKNSREYQLLLKGVVVHYGKMPGLMARLLVEVIEERIIHLVLATSTLSEGVNLPFETVIIPSLRRYDGDLSAREFGNLAGRAGRPGFGTEGRTLVLLPSGGAATPALEQRMRQMRLKYGSLIAELQGQSALGQANAASSPIAALLLHIMRHWAAITRSNSLGEFYEWLEATAPLRVDSPAGKLPPAVEALDTLDALLLSVVVEAEQLSAEILSADALEAELQTMWRRSYAHYSSAQEARLGDIFVRRGRALFTSIYPDAKDRRQLYRTSVPPRFGSTLLLNYSSITLALKAGDDYAVWNADARFNYIREIAERITSLPKFTLSKMFLSKPPLTWQQVLRWWLDPWGAARGPTSREVADWLKYVNDNFNYKFNWGLGSVIALAIDDVHGGQLRESVLEEWPKTGLPWVVFWMKELIVWGTLDPVVACALAQGFATTRRAGEEIARTYYQAVQAEQEDLSSDEILNASRIRKWLAARAPRATSAAGRNIPEKIGVTLLRDFSAVPTGQTWRVLPVKVDGQIKWIDPAGFTLASSAEFHGWEEGLVNSHDFTLDAHSNTVTVEPYL